MNAKTNRWESYVDSTGRRHWRWPALPGPAAAPGLPAPRAALSLPQPREAPLLPRYLRGK